MPRTTPAVLFLPNLSKENLNSYFTLGGILIVVGTALIYMGVWLVPALLITAIGANVFAKFLAYAFPKLYYNKLAFSLGNSGVYAGCIAGFYLGSLFPGIGNIFGALIGMGIGFVMGPLLSLGLANLFDYLRIADPVGIGYADQGSTIGWWLGALIGAGIGFFTPVGPIIGSMIGIVAGSSLVALFMGIGAYFFSDNKPFQPDLYGDLPSTSMTNLMVTRLDETMPDLRAHPELYSASERIVNVTSHRKESAPPKQISDFHPQYVDEFLKGKKLDGTQQLNQEIIEMEMPGVKKSEILFSYSITPRP